MSKFTAARTNMVDCQIATAGVSVPAIIESFECVPREMFVPKAMQNVAYMDEQICVGDGRYLLEPITHARMVQALEPSHDDVVLDVGGASGYSAAILSPLVTTVVAIEDDESFIKLATKIWNDVGVSNAVAIEASLREGDPDNAPYDLIFMNGAVEDVPQSLVEQLSPQGRLITIVKASNAVMGQVVLVIKNADGEGFSSRVLFEAAAPYLSGYEPKPTFVF